MISKTLLLFLETSGIPKASHTESDPNLIKASDNFSADFSYRGSKEMVAELE